MTTGPDDAAAVGRSEEKTEFTAAPRESIRDMLVLDVGGLLISFFVGSFVVARTVDALFAGVLPSSRASLPLSPVSAFLVGFVGLDYLQYWSHRLFHAPRLFRFHRAHHTVVRMNGIAAFRHSIWECLLSPTFWGSATIAWWLADPSYFFIAGSTGFALDVYRHSSLTSRGNTWIACALRSVLVTPEEHAVHHREPALHANYGANLRIWDRIHRTYRAPGTDSGVYGAPHRDTALSLLLLASEPEP